MLRQFAGEGWITIHGGSARTSLATLPVAARLERVLPSTAGIIRDECRWLAENGGWGSIANFIGDETAIDYMSGARFDLFRKNVVNLRGGRLCNQPQPGLHRGARRSGRATHGRLLRLGAGPAIRKLTSAARIAVRIVQKPFAEFRSPFPPVRQSPRYRS